jgi:hypothetical protein
MEWIRITDRFPEIGERVLVFQKNGVFGGNEVDIAYRTHEYYPDSPDRHNLIAWDGQGICNDIHYWMPLPEPPKEKNNEK